MTSRIFVCVLSLLCLLVTSSLCEDPEVHYDAIQLITTKGYPAESHWVTTSDGYILCLHRIPGPKGSHPSPNDPARPVFFLQHGLLCSSTNWLTNLANESLGYILADAGYDVWMGNVRGNTYSRNHTTLETNSKKFWNFSFDEHAQIDLPFMLDYVMNYTGQKELFYVGHSQGTVMGFAGFTVNQTLASHIKTFFALAPVTTVKHIKGLFAFVSDIYKEVEFLFDLFGDGEFFPNSELIKSLAEHVCPLDTDIDKICENVLFLICGFDPANTNLTRVPVYFTHAPAGTSVKNCIHYCQEVHSGLFGMYDYGKKNVQHYGTDTPPSYNLSTLQVPTALFTGGQDWLADPQDVATMIPIVNTTGNIIHYKNIPSYDHLDFIWGLNASTLIYNDILNYAHKMMQQP